MLLEVVVAPYFQTNCWIFAPKRNSECFIVDPGIANPNLMGAIKEVINRNNLKPIASLITHGHLDHTFSVVPFCSEYQIPALIHSIDRRLLLDPFRALQAGGMSAQIMSELGVTSFTEPQEVRELKDLECFEIAGFKIEVSHAPGHTAGSAMFNVDGAYLISGDVLFAGGIGRTDMPTGSAQEMRNSLRNKILPLDDELIVLPGHGPQTTIARERRSNPYLQETFLNSKAIKGE